MNRDGDLGLLVAIYRGRPIRRQLFTWGLVGILAVLLPLGYGWRLGAEAYGRYGPVAAEAWSRPWYLLAALALALFLPYCLYRIIISHRFVAVHEQGLRLNVPARGFFPRLRSYTLTWDEISGVSTDWVKERFLGRPLETAQGACLHLRHGEPVRLDGRLQDVPGLVDRIKTGLYPRLLAQLQATLQAGEDLAFGPLIVSRQYLHLYPPGTYLPLSRPHSLPRDPLPWRCVQQIEAQSGRLLILFSTPTGGKPQKCMIPIAKIPNLELLIQVVQQGADL